MDTDALSPDFPVSTPESPSTQIGYSIKYYKWGFENKEFTVRYNYAIIYATRNRKGIKRKKVEEDQEQGKHMGK